MNTPISPERAAVIKQESIDYLRTTKSTSLKDAYIAGATAYAPYKQQCEELERWKEEAILVMSPLLDYGQSKEAEIPLGASITTTILQRAKQFQQAKKELEEYAAAHKPLPWQNVSGNANYKLYQRVNDLLATWKEEGKEGGNG